MAGLFACIGYRGGYLFYRGILWEHMRWDWESEPVTYREPLWVLALWGLTGICKAGNALRRSEWPFKRYRAEIGR